MFSARKSEIGPSVGYVEQMSSFSPTSISMHCGYCHVVLHTTGVSNSIAVLECGHSVMTSSFSHDVVLLFADIHTVHALVS